MNWLRAHYRKYRQPVMFLIFGILTTLINYVTYIIFSHLFHESASIWPSAVAWFFAVMFAYFTNRKWVFRSNAHKGEEIRKELFSFLGARVLTGIIDIIIMYIFVDVLSYNGAVVKFLSNVLVTIFNYTLSKLVIFRGLRNSSDAVKVNVGKSG